MKSPHKLSKSEYQSKFYNVKCYLNLSLIEFHLEILKMLNLLEFHSNKLFQAVLMDLINILSKVNCSEMQADLI